MEQDSDTVTSDDSCVSLEEKEDDARATEADPSSVDFEFKKIGKVVRGPYCNIKLYLKFC